MKSAAPIAGTAPALRGGALVALVALLVGVACGDDDPAEEGNTAERTAKVVAVALTSNVTFENGTVTLGAIPDPSAQSVMLSQENQSSSLAPGDSEILALEVDNPDQEDDPVVATLLQFEDDEDQHIEVPFSDENDAGMGSNGINIPFMVNSKVCDKLCNKRFSLNLIQAVKLKSKKISRHLKRAIQLDCTDDGDPKMCEKPAEDEGDAGAQNESGKGSTSNGGTGGGATTGTTNFAREVSAALGAANSALCKCDGFSSDPCDAIVVSSDRSCVNDLIAENATDPDVQEAFTDLTVALNMALGACMACDTTTCSPTLLSDTLDALPEEVSAMFYAQCTGGVIPEPMMSEQ